MMQNIQNYRTIPVSVIVPCFNNEEFLVQCIESINSKIPPDEIIIIDDKSTDRSLLLAKQLALRFSNLKIIQRNENGGCPIARREGINLARNELIALVDSDDIIDADAIAIAFDKLCEDGSDICIWNLWQFDSNKEWCAINLDPKAFPKSGRQAVLETLGGWRIHPIGVAKKSIYVSAYAEIEHNCVNSDEMATRLVFANSKRVSLCNSKYFYRANPNSLTRKLSPRQLTQLRSHVWLLNFAKSYPEADRDLMAKSAISLAYHFYKNRKVLGAIDTQRELRRFFSEFANTYNPFNLIFRYPKHFFGYWAIIALSKFLGKS